MFAFDCWFDSRAALSEALLSTFEEGGLFIAGSHAVTSGSPATVRLGAQGLRVGLFLEGLVQWRRTPSRTPGVKATAAGIGIRLLPDQHERFAFLQKWSSGTLEESGRTELRYPMEQRVIVTTALGGRTAKIVHGRVRDVSRRGALLATPGELPVGLQVTVEVMFKNASVPGTARVVRSNESFAAVRIETTDAAAEERWARVQSIAADAFQQRLGTGTLRPPPSRI